MDSAAYSAETDVEATHWWFEGRRRLFARIMKRLGIGPDAVTLDAGSSSGTNLRLLKNLGHTRYEGLDFSEESARMCAEKGLGHVRIGDIRALPYADDHFDFVLATDIIEHVDDDAKALAEIARVLKPGAPVLITVPTFMALWGPQDDLAHHKRRYRLNDLRRLVLAAGLTIEDSFHFNYILFLPILAARRLLKAAARGPVSENRINTPLINVILKGLFTVDIRTAPFIKPPFGVSGAIIARKPRGTS